MSQRAGGRTGAAGRVLQNRCRAAISRNGTRALFILAGLISVAFGVVLCARPHVGAITLALLFGLFNLIIGIWMIVQGIELRRTGKTLDSGFPEKAAGLS